MIHKPRIIPLSPLPDLVLGRRSRTIHDVEMANPFCDEPDEFADRRAALEGREGKEPVVAAVGCTEDLDGRRDSFHAAKEFREAVAGVGFGVVRLRFATCSAEESVGRAGHNVGLWYPAWVVAAPSVSVDDGVVDLFEVEVRVVFEVGGA